MAKRSIVKIVEQEYQKMVDANLSADEIRSIQKERRKMVESEIYRYNSSGRIIEALEDRIEREREKLSAPGTPVLSDMPKGPANPNKTTEKMAEAIDKIIAWERRINEEKGKNEMFKRAWETLDCIEQQALSLRFCADGGFLDAGEAIDKLGYSKKQFYRILNMGLDILALQLFGSVGASHPFIEI